MYDYELLSMFSALMSLVYLLGAILGGVLFFFVIDPLTTLLSWVSVGIFGVAKGSTKLSDFMDAVIKYVKEAKPPTINPTQ